MKRLVFSIVCTLAATVANADYTAGYYDAMNGTGCEALKSAAKYCVTSHTVLNYNKLPDYWQYSDVYPEPVGGSRRWWDMYSDAVYLIGEEQTGAASFSENKMQREHCIPKSWWKKDDSVDYTPAYSDMWNLYPSDASANRAKSNYPFGMTASASFDNGVSKVGPPCEGYGGGSAMVFEPADEYKGDFARSIFYMATVYDDINWVITYMFEPSPYPTLTPWAVDMLLDWSRRDGVSRKETDRNDAVEQFQGNRNPFVDFPELAEYIWGSRMAETFLIADQQDNPAQLPVIACPGGFKTGTKGNHQELRIFDADGKPVTLSADMDAGDVIPLTPGLYIVAAPGARPQKIIITPNP